MKHVLDHFKKVDPIMYETASQIKLTLPTRGSDYFRNLARSIIGQQLSVKAAATIYSRFENLVGGKVLPEKVLELDKEKLRKAGISYSKISYITELSDKVLSGDITFKKITEKSDEEVLETLIKIKGVGKWTGEMFLIFTLGREDVFSHGDVGLQRAMKNLYKLEKYEYEIFEKISSKWSPYRSYASYALWQTLDNEPK